MPFSPEVARFNKRVTNKVTRLFAGRVPGFAIISHTGRKSGKMYETPINVFRTATGYRVALTYGAQAEWVKNVLASGECTLRVLGRNITCRNPHLGSDPTNSWAPWFVRQIIGGAGVTEYLDLTAGDGAR